MVGLAVFAAVAWFAPWRVVLTLYAIAAAMILTISHGQLAHW